MATIVQPVIATRADVAQYLGLSAGSLGGTLADGVSTLADYVDRCLIDTAWLLTEWCNYDYTPAQKHEVIFQGNNESFYDVPYPLATFTLLNRYPIGTNAINTVQTLSTSSLTFQSQNNFRIWIQTGTADNLTYFDDSYIWTIYYTTAAIAFTQPPTYGTVTNNSWPEAIKQVQIEMIGIRIRESAIGWGGGGTAVNAAGGMLGFSGTYPLDNTRHGVKFVDMLPRWQKIVREYRHYSI